ncbi:hypothetical protein FLA_2640 [Filimonas lacunae]|nr:hypothetical protein FLA_2640 [Filimonas lacunae]
MVSISKGQFVISVTNFNIRARFDSAAPVKYSCSMANDGSSDVVFINDAKGFISKVNQKHNCVNS